MPNPFYTRKQKGMAILWISQFLLSAFALTILKLGKHPLFVDKSWWLITCPVWLPVLILLLLAGGAIVFFGIKADREKVKQYLEDLEKKESSTKSNYTTKIN